jgi:hypothetical protein
MLPLAARVPMAVTHMQTPVLDFLLLPRGCLNIAFVHPLSLSLSLAAMLSAIEAVIALVVYMQ